MNHTPGKTKRSRPDRSGADPSSSRAFLADGAALGVSALFSALVGLLGWLLAARLLSPAEVGRASAFVNGFIFVAGVAELGLGQACLKWLPVSGQHTRAVLTRVYGGVLVSAVVVAVVWGLVTRHQITGQTGIGMLGALVLFVVAAVGWTLFHVQNFVLTSLGAARWVPVEMVSFGIVRVVLLVVLAQLLGPLGIVLSWVVPTVLWVLVFLVALSWRRHRLDGVPGVAPARGETARMAGSIYVSTFGMTLMVSLVPVLVTARNGPAVGAVFFVVWNGVAAVELAAAGFGSALVVRLAGDNMLLLRRSLRQVLPLFVVPLAIAAVGATPLLSLFGKTYADGGVGMLRWVCLGLVLRLVGVMVASIHLVESRTARLVVVNAGPAVALIATILVLPAGTGLGTLGLAYVVIQAVFVAFSVLDLRGLAGRARRTDLQTTVQPPE